MEPSWCFRWGRTVTTHTGEDPKLLKTGREDRPGLRELFSPDHHTEKGAFDAREGTVCLWEKSTLARESKHTNQSQE